MCAGREAGKLCPGAKHYKVPRLSTNMVGVPNWHNKVLGTYRRTGSLILRRASTEDVDGVGQATRQGEGEGRESEDGGDSEGESGDEGGDSESEGESGDEGGDSGDVSAGTGSGEGGEDRGGEGEVKKAVKKKPPRDKAVFSIKYFLPGGKDRVCKRGMCVSPLESYDAAVAVARQIHEIRYSDSYDKSVYTSGLHAAARDPRFAQHVCAKYRARWPAWCK